jgi:hypothetical protein
LKKKVNRARPHPPAPEWAWLQEKLERFLRQELASAPQADRRNRPHSGREEAPRHSPHPPPFSPEWSPGWESPGPPPWLKDAPPSPQTRPQQREHLAEHRRSDPVWTDPWENPYLDGWEDLPPWGPDREGEPNRGREMPSAPESHGKPMLFRPPDFSPGQGRKSGRKVTDWEKLSPTLDETESAENLRIRSHSRGKAKRRKKG